MLPATRVRCFPSNHGRKYESLYVALHMAKHEVLSKLQPSNQVRAERGAEYILLRLGALLWEGALHLELEHPHQLTEGFRRVVGTAAPSYRLHCP